MKSIMGMEPAKKVRSDENLKWGKYVQIRAE
jgi:hypothetical protein